MAYIRTLGFVTLHQTAALLFPSTHRDALHCSSSLYINTHSPWALTSPRWPSASHCFPWGDHSHTPPLWLQADSAPGDPTRAPSRRLLDSHKAASQLSAWVTETRWQLWLTAENIAFSAICCMTYHKRHWKPAWHTAELVVWVWTGTYSFKQRGR